MRKFSLDLVQETRLSTTDLILPLMTFLAFLFYSVASDSSLVIASFSSGSSSKFAHFFTIVCSILATLSAKNGKDHEKTLRPSGSLYGGSVS